MYRYVKASSEGKKQEVLKVESLIEYYPKLQGRYQYYIVFEPLHEYLTNSKRLFDKLEEGKSYLVEYYPTPDRCVAPNTASIMLDMKGLKILEEV